MNILSIVVLIFAILFMIIVIILCVVYVTKGKKKKMPLNLPLVENFMPAKTKGYSEGLELQVVPAKNKKRSVCYFYATDLAQPTDIFEPKRTGEILRIIVENNRRIMYAPGNFSSERIKVKYLPLHNDEIPIEQRDMFMNKINNATVENVLLRGDREAMRRIATIVESYAGGEVSREEMTKQREMVEESMSAISRGFEKLLASIGKGKKGKDTM